MRFVKFNFGAHDLTLNFTNFTPFLRRIYVMPWAYLKNLKKTNIASSGVHAPVQIEILPAALKAHLRYLRRFKRQVLWRFQIARVN